MTDRYDDLQLYWGDLHCHVREWRRDRFSSGERGAPGPWTLDEVYAFGRCDSKLDYVAVTDHDTHLEEAEWSATEDAAERLSEEGRFVAFLGYEWSHVPGQPSGDYGHRNVIYRHCRGPLVRCDSEDANTAPKLWAALRRQLPDRDMIVIPHHPARAASGVCWNLDVWDPELERLVEVYSLWGSSERPGPPFEIHYLKEHSSTGRGEAPGHFVQDALARGYRFGLVGGSESHDGRPGNPLFHGPHECGVAVCYRGGIQGTYAPALARDALFDAFRARRCFATTGVKIGLRFSLNGAIMGETCEFDRERHLRVRVTGTAPVARIDVVRNNRNAHSVSPGGARAEFEWQDHGEKAGDTYYVRVTQSDGNMAWSSPIWVG